MFGGYGGGGSFTASNYNGIYFLFEQLDFYFYA
jgi:hypothetical protein